MIDPTSTFFGIIRFLIVFFWGIGGIFSTINFLNPR